MKVLSNLLLKFYLWWLKTFENLYLKGYYRTIEELPMEMYILVNERKDLKYLHKKHKGNSYYQSLVYDSINDQIIDKYGASKEFIERLKDDIDLAIMKADGEDQLFIDILEHDIEKKYQSKQVNQNSLREAVIWIEKHQGYKISTKEITVDEFYSYIDFITKNNK